MALADGTALYRIRGDKGLLLYIGISDNFGRRWRQHAEKQPWWGEMRSLSVDKWFGRRADAETAEKAAIKVEKPKYNKVHATRPSACSTPSLPSRANELALARIARLRDNSPKRYREAEARKCPSCGARPGDFCRTRNGNVAYFHLDRWTSDGRLTGAH